MTIVTGGGSGAAANAGEERTGDANGCIDVEASFGYVEAPSGGGGGIVNNAVTGSYHSAQAQFVKKTGAEAPADASQWQEEKGGDGGGGGAADNSNSAIGGEQPLFVERIHDGNDDEGEDEAGSDSNNGLVASIVVFALFVLSIFLPDGCDESSGTNCTRYHSHYSAGSGGGYWGRGGGGGHGGSCFPAGERVDVLVATDADTTRNSTATAQGGVVAGVPIEHLRPGDVAAHGGGLITAVLKLRFDPGRDALYRYNDAAWVTGSHAVLDADVDGSGRWRRVADSPLAFAAKSGGGGAAPAPHPEYVYNLITEGHRVVINGTVFSDWEEIDPPTDAETERDLLATLNGGNDGSAERRSGRPSLGSDSSDETERVERASASCRQGRHLVNVGVVVGDGYVGEGAFAAGTPVFLRDGGGATATATPIELLEPGDEIEGGGTVEAVVRLLVRAPPPVLPTRLIDGCSEAADDNEDVRLLWLYDNLTMTSPWTIVLDEEDWGSSTWRHVRDSARSMVVRHRHRHHHRRTTARGVGRGGHGRRRGNIVMYQLITSSHRVVVDGTTFADYEVFEALGDDYASNLARLNACEDEMVGV